MSIVKEGNEIRIQAKTTDQAVMSVKRMIKDGLINPKNFNQAKLNYDMNNKVSNPRDDKHYALIFNGILGQRLLVSGITAGMRRISSQGTIRILELMGFPTNEEEKNLIVNETRNVFGERETHIQRTFCKG